MDPDRNTEGRCSARVALTNTPKLTKARHCLERLRIISIPLVREKSVIHWRMGRAKRVAISEQIMDTAQIRTCKTAPLILVAALGYFVDAYDLIVASVARSSAIVDLGLAETGTTAHQRYAYLFENSQSLGILAGGIIFGILGDKIGRKNVLYTSIFVYSVANILNSALISSVPHVGPLYCLLRFICGFALAAELSVSVVMIVETMNAKTRGHGSMVVVSFGVLGCVSAAVLFEFFRVPWQSLFLIGGIAGLLLLGLRYRVSESPQFLTLENQTSERGNLMTIFRRWDLTKAFVGTILLGFPIYFFVSIPIKFATDYGKEIGLTLVGTTPIITYYVALSISGIIANYSCQWLESRKKVLYFYILFSLVPITGLYVFPPTSSEQYLYIFAPLMGIGSGYWALLFTYATEQVGINIRSTFATSVPNIIRSMFIPISMLFTFLHPNFGTSFSVFLIGVATVCLALVGNYFLKETWGRDLNFVEKL